MSVITKLDNKTTDTSNNPLPTGVNRFCERFRNFFNGIFAAISKLFSSCFSCKSRNIEIEKNGQEDGQKVPFKRLLEPNRAPSAPAPAAQSNPAETTENPKDDGDITDEDAAGLEKSTKPTCEQPSNNTQLLRAHSKPNVENKPVVCSNGQLFVQELDASVPVKRMPRSNGLPALPHGTKPKFKLTPNQTPVTNTKQTPPPKPNVS